jgi:hypothetical protein
MHAIFAKLAEWFADAHNGITDFFARVGNFGRVNTHELCIKATCVDEDQLKALLLRRQPPAHRNLG